MAPGKDSYAGPQRFANCCNALMTIVITFHARYTRCKVFSVFIFREKLICGNVVAQASNLNFKVKLKN